MPSKQPSLHRHDDMAAPFDLKTSCLLLEVAVESVCLHILPGSYISVKHSFNPGLAGTWNVTAAGKLRAALPHIYMPRDPESSATAQCKIARRAIGRVVDMGRETHTSHRNNNRQLHLWGWGTLQRDLQSMGSAWHHEASYPGARLQKRACQH